MLSKQSARAVRSKGDVNPGAFILYAGSSPADFFRGTDFNALVFYPCIILEEYGIFLGIECDSPVLRVNKNNYGYHSNPTATANPFIVINIPRVYSFGRCHCIFNKTVNNEMFATRPDQPVGNQSYATRST